MSTWESELKADSCHSHSCRSDLHALRFYSWADSHSSTSFMVGKLGNLAQCRCYYHDVGLASFAMSL
jgi:hypothetical protein